MEKIKLQVSALAPAAGPQYVIVLQEENGIRRLPIVIGLPEAQAIAMEIEKINRSRPMTHDLFVNTLSAFGIYLKEIIITKIDQDGVFHSELVCEQDGTHTKIRIDSRTSDAIALALRFNCSIFVFEEVLESASFSVEEQGKKTKQKEHPKAEAKPPTKKEIIEEKIVNLENKLNKAIETENYELAAKLKEEINKLKENLK